MPILRASSATPPAASMARSSPSSRTWTSHPRSPVCRSIIAFVTKHYGASVVPVPETRQSLLIATGYSLWSRPLLTAVRHHACNAAERVRRDPHSLSAHDRLHCNSGRHGGPGTPIRSYRVRILLEAPPCRHSAEESAGFSTRHPAATAPPCARRRRCGQRVRPDLLRNSPAVQSPASRSGR